MNFPQRVVLLLFAASLLAGLMTGQQLYYRLTYLWGLLFAFSWLMSRFSLRGLQVVRRARSLRSQVGQVYEERFELRNPSRLPRLWIEVRDLAPIPSTAGSHVLTLVGGRESRSYMSRTRLTERGVFSLGPTVLASGDLFGLFPTSLTFDAKETLLVYPMLFPVSHFPSPAGLLPGGEALRRRTAQITSNASGVREYAPGDPLNRIHWLSTARRNRLMVKEFELDPLAEVWIFVDGFKVAHASLPRPVEDIDPRDMWRKRAPLKLPPSTIEYAVSIAGSLARYYLQLGRAVGLVSAGSALNILPSDRGGRQLGKILETLAMLQADGPLPLPGQVEAQARHLPRGSTVVLITPSTSDSTVKAADLLMRRGLRPVVVLLEPSTFGGYFSSEPIFKQIQFLGIPVVKISNGDDVGAALSEASRAQKLH